MLGGVRVPSLFRFDVADSKLRWNLLEVGMKIVSFPWYVDVWTYKPMGKVTTLFNLKLEDEQRMEQREGLKYLPTSEPKHGGKAFLMQKPAGKVGLDSSSRF